MGATWLARLRSLCMRCGVAVEVGGRVGLLELLVRREEDEWGRGVAVHGTCAKTALGRASRSVWLGLDAGGCGPYGPAVETVCTHRAPLFSLLCSVYLANEGQRVVVVRVQVSFSERGLELIYGESGCWRRRSGLVVSVGSGCSL